MTVSSIDAILNEALYGPKGFYENQNITDHFITPSIGGQHYAEILAKITQKRGGLRDFVEYGAGSGELAQFLAPLCQSYQIIERSSYCAQQQKQKLSRLSSVSWQNEIQAQRPVCVLLQEVFDCLTEKAFCLESDQAFEVVWDRDQSQLCQLKVIHRNAALEHYKEFLQEYVPVELWQQGQVFFLPQKARELLTNLFQRLPKGSQVLIVDYSESQPQLAQSWETQSPPLRAYFQQQQIPIPWGNWGTADLTYDPDLYYLMHCWLGLGGQVDHYGELGPWLAQACQELSLPLPPSCRLLAEPRMMGTRFKVLALSRS